MEQRSDAMEDRIEYIMRTLDCSEQEALQLIEDDKAVDRMTKTAEIQSDLTQEQKKASKKARAVAKAPKAKAPTAYKWETKKQKKRDNEKHNVIKLFINALEGDTNVKDIKMLNEDREFEFLYNDRKIKVTLIAPRK